MIRARTKSYGYIISEDQKRREVHHDKMVGLGIVGVFLGMLTFELLFLRIVTRK